MAELSRLEQEAIDYFVSFTGLFGLPRSLGEIYGLLFVTREGIPMDEVVSRLGISKGSASQGLRLLGELEIVTKSRPEGERKEHYRADFDVSRIVNAFTTNRLMPRLDNADERISRMKSLAQNLEGQDETEATKRIVALEKWQEQGRSILPMILQFLDTR